MICRSLLRLIAIPTIVVFVLFLVIQPEAIGRGGGGGERGGGGGELTRWWRIFPRRFSERGTVFVW